MEQCRQGKSATRIRNFGKRIGSEPDPQTGGSMIREHEEDISDDYEDGQYSQRWDNIRGGPLISAILRYKWEDGDLEGSQTICTVPWESQWECKGNARANLLLKGDFFLTIRRSPTVGIPVLYWSFERRILNIVHYWNLTQEAKSWVDKILKL